MASKLDELEAEALSLPVADRARLVSRLLASLDEQVDEDVDLAWIEEAGRRYHFVANRTAMASRSAGRSASRFSGGSIAASLNSSGSTAMSGYRR